MLNNEITISNHEELSAAMVATLFTPLEIGEDFIKYDKQSILFFAEVLEHVFEKWYNCPLDIKMETE